MIQVDFTPEWYRLQLRVKRSRRSRLIYVATLVVFMVAWLVISRDRIQRAEAAVAEAHKYLHQARSRFGALQGIVQQRDKLRDQLEIHTRLDTVFPARFILSEIVHWLPEEVWLEKFVLHKQGETWQETHPPVRRAAARTADKYETEFSDCEVTITVRATEYRSLYECVENLNESTFFERVVPKPSRPIDGTALIEKEITLYVINARHIAHERQSP